MEIYANGVGNGWAFVAFDKEIVHTFYSGGTDVIEKTACAMGILQALYWAKGGYDVIYSNCDWRESTLVARIQPFYPRIEKTEHNYLTEFSDSLAVKAMWNILNHKNLNFDDVNPGDNIIAKKPLWSQSYLVMMKLYGSQTIVLKNMTTTSKKNEVYNKEQFDNGEFILM